MISTDRQTEGGGESKLELEREPQRHIENFLIGFFRGRESLKTTIQKPQLNINI